MKIAAFLRLHIIPRFTAGLLLCLAGLFSHADETAEYKAALVVAEQVASDFPQHPQSYILLGKVHQALSQWDEAVVNFKKSLELDPNNPEAAVNCAQVYEKQYEYEHAIEWYQKAATIASPQYGLYEKIGLNYMQLNQMEEAAQAFKQELQHHPNNASTHYYLAQRMLEANELESAKHHAEKCMELDVRYPEPVYLLAQIARKQKEMPKAQEYLKLFREKKKKESEYVEEIETTSATAQTLEAQVSTFAGAMNIQQGKIQRAEDYLRKAIALDPKQETARVNLMQLYIQTKNATKLEHILRELHALKPDNINYMVQLGETLNAKQQWNEALPLLERAYERDQSLQTKRALAHVLITSQKDPNRGLQFMLEVVQENPAAKHYDLLSRAYYVTRNLPLCIEAMLMASQLEPNNPTYRKRLQKLQALKQ